MQIAALDHFVLTVQDIAKTCDFYQRVLGMQVITYGDNRTALHFGNQKINLHQFPSAIEPRAAQPIPGSADLRFLTDTPIKQVVAHLQQNNILIIEGPVQRTGAVHTIESVYFRDLDGNLIEVSNEIRA